MEHDDNQPVSLQEAADLLGVHYMTAYRYVRTGRLAASRHRGQWMVEPAALAVFEAEHARARAGRRAARGAGRSGRVVEGVYRSLVQGDEAGVWQQAQDQLAYGLEPEELYLKVLARAMRLIGEAWARGDIDVSEEHRASVVMQRVLGRLGPLFVTRGRRRGTIVLGAPARERHSLPVTFVADPLRGRHFEVSDLGADVPVESLAQAAGAADRLIGVGLCATTASERSIREAVRALHEAADAPVVLGGAAVRDARAATRLGADHYSSDATDALAIFESLATGRR